MKDTITKAARPVAALSLLAGLLVTLYFVTGSPRRHVPDVMGMTTKAAVERLARHDLFADFIVDRTAGRHVGRRWAGRVVHQTWRRGMALPEGSTLRVTLFPRRAPPDRRAR